MVLSGLFLFHLIMGGGCPLAEQWSMMLMIIQQVRCLARHVGGGKECHCSHVHLIITQRFMLMT